MEKVLLIGAAGALGAISRYAVQTWFNALNGGPTVVGTLIVNVSGAFLIGLLVALTEERYLTSGPWRAMLAVGFLGAYTTFSTLMFDVETRLEGGDIAPALLNLGASVIFGLLAVYAGLSLGRTVS